MSNQPNPAPPCPNCGGTEGYEYQLVVTHLMNGAWGQEATAADSLDTRTSLACCLDCGTKFQLASLKKRGLSG